MPGPFESLRVIEFGRFIAAPYCGQLLADGGADVIKVEPLEGDETRRNGAIVPGEGRQFLNKTAGNVHWQSTSVIRRWQPPFAGWY